MDDSNINLCRFLEWDSNFFGCRIAQIVPHKINKDEMRQILAWCNDESIDCLYFLAASDDRDSVILSETAGFRFVDVRVTLEARANGLDTPSVNGKPIVLRSAKAQDVPALRKIAGVLHRDGRFHFDPQFDEELCDRLYQTWIENSCNGYADKVIICEYKSMLAGYITCHLREDGTGNIGLLGVDSEYQGLGLGRLLVMEALGWFASQGVQNVNVVTQGRNCRSQRLYQRCGFTTSSVQLWYHRWFFAKGKGIQ